LRPDALGLVDAFGIPASCLGPLADAEYLARTGFDRQGRVVIALFDRAALQLAATRLVIQRALGKNWAEKQGKTPDAAARHRLAPPPDDCFCTYPIRLLERLEQRW
jgi:hypothetical protein